MLSFFKINDPYRLISVFILLLAIRLPVILDPESLTLLELKWMLVGEKMGNGSTVYLDIIDDTAPFSAGVYWLADIIFGIAQTIENVAFSIKRSLRRINIFGRLIFFERPAAKGDWFAAQIINGNHQPMAEA